MPVITHQICDRIVQIVERNQIALHLCLHSKDSGFTKFGYENDKLFI
jgi:hypothetical protein